MVYTANIVTVAEMQLMAGENVDATGDVDANHIILQDHAEAYLSDLLKFKLTAAAFTAMDADVKAMISEWAARYAGSTLIMFNVSGYSGTLQEAITLVNFHLLRMQQIERVLQSDGVQDFMGVNT